jgi:hypothetical protein
VVLIQPRDLRRHLRNAGLHVTGQGYALFFPPGFKKLAGAERMLEWLPLGGQYWVCATRT